MSISFWISRADQAYKEGKENLKNVLNVYGANTFFLPVDAAFNKFANRDLLNNNTFLVDVILRSHRVSNQNLFDQLLEDSAVNYYTDTQLPVSATHRYVEGKLEIEISIGHVRGKLLPNFRNIYCASGVVHLVETVLGIATESVYTKISNNKELGSFKALIDKSPKYSALLKQVKTLITVLAPTDLALVSIKDDLLLASTSAIDFVFYVYFIN